MIEQDIKLLEHCVLDLQHRVLALEAQIKALQKAQVKALQRRVMELQAERKTEPQTDYTPDCPFCKRYGTEDCLGYDCRHYKTYKTEPQTERKE